MRNAEVRSHYILECGFCTYIFIQCHKLNKFPGIFKFGGMVQYEGKLRVN